MIRKMKFSDIEPVLEIETAVFDYPWNKNQFYEEIENERAICRVYVMDRTLVGYLIAWNLLGEIEIGIIATSKGFQNKGIGRQLLEHLFQEIADKHSCFLEVSSKNRNAQSFYFGLGFQKISERKKYYQDGSDALILQKIFKHT